MIAHYERRARGGVGMVIVENVAVCPAGRQLPLQPMLDNDGKLPGFHALATRIKASGALIVMQIVHAGRYAGSWQNNQIEKPVSASRVPFKSHGALLSPAAATQQEIADSISYFAYTARLAQQAGFDGVEIHAGQGFLISSFLSPLMNLRTDEWGGSFENRTNYLFTILREIREVTSNQFIMGLHLFADELRVGGWQLDDAVIVAEKLDHQIVDFIIPTIGTFETMHSAENAERFDSDSYLIEEISTIRASAAIPVFANGGIRDPAKAEAILQDGLADGIALARPLFADPDWPTKVLQGREADLVLCDCVNSTCLRTQLTGAICEAWQ